MVFRKRKKSIQDDCEDSELLPLNSSNGTNASGNSTRSSRRSCTSSLLILSLVLANTVVLLYYLPLIILPLVSEDTASAYREALFADINLVSNEVGQTLNYGVDFQSSVKATNSSSIPFNPILNKVRPRFGPEAGGTLVVITGWGFGDGSAPLSATIGGRQCQQTRYVSDTTIYCVTPAGKGLNLNIGVSRCDCGIQKTKHQYRTRGSAQFSYRESILAGALQKFPKAFTLAANTPVQLNKKMLVASSYELSFLDPDGFRHGTIVHPQMLSLLPHRDHDARYGTCAVVGPKGSLTGSKLGEIIDAKDAVFRVDGSPSGKGHESDVGRKVTYQVLDQSALEKLLYVSEGSYKIGRWWEEREATLVLWDHLSEKMYMDLRTISPRSEILFLSRELERYVHYLVSRVGQYIGEETGEASILQAVKRYKMTSLLYATVMASRMCDKVFMYGTRSECRGLPADAEEECELFYWRIRIAGAPAKNPGTVELEDWIVDALDKNFAMKQAAGGGEAGEDEHGLGRPLTVRKDTAVRILEATAEEFKAVKVVNNDHTGSLFQGVCDPSACQITCSQGTRVLSGGFEGCACDDSFVGAHCDENILRREENLSKFRDLLDSKFDRKRGIVMTKENVKFGKDESETYFDLTEKIPLVNTTESIDRFNFNSTLYQKLPVREGQIFSTKGSSSENEWGSCALIGNSGALLHAYHGDDIDSHDIVYRFNQAPTAGYEEHVGSRTTHESMNSAWFRNMVDGTRADPWRYRESDTSYVVYEFFDPSPYDSREYERIQVKENWWGDRLIEMHEKFPNRELAILSPAFLQWSYSLYKQFKDIFEITNLGHFAGEKPMSGYYATLFLLQVCDKVTMYGFMPYKDKDIEDPVSTRYHYFDGAIPRGGSHSFDLTRRIYELISFHNPNFVMVD